MTMVELLLSISSNEDGVDDACRSAITLRGVILIADKYRLERMCKLVDQ